MTSEPAFLYPTRWSRSADESRAREAGAANGLKVAADPGLTIFTYTPEPGSRSEEALRLLGSWAATPDQAEPTGATGPT